MEVSGSLFRPGVHSDTTIRGEAISKGRGRPDRPRFPILKRQATEFKREVLTLFYCLFNFVTRRWQKFNFKLEAVVGPLNHKIALIGWWFVFLESLYMSSLIVYTQIEKKKKNRRSWSIRVFRKYAATLDRFLCVSLSHMGYSLTALTFGHLSESTIKPNSVFKDAPGPSRLAWSVHYDKKSIFKNNVRPLSRDNFIKI